MPRGDDPPSPLEPAFARRAVLLTLACGFVYLLVGGGFRFAYTQTEFPHHLLMADAFLHGQLHIRDAIIEKRAKAGFERGMLVLQQEIQNSGRPWSESEQRGWMNEWMQYRIMHDWAIANLNQPSQRLYGYWAPLTPVLMIPFVAAFGTDVSDTLINCLFGAANVGLFYWFLRRIDRLGLVGFSEGCRTALTLLFAFGTVHFYLVCDGRVWFAVQVCTLTALLATCIAATSARNDGWSWLLTGVLFGSAILARNLVIVMGLFFVLLIWLRTSGDGAARRKVFLKRSLAFCVPLVVAVMIQAAYNYGRFGSAFEDGLRIQIVTGVDPRYKEYYEEFGLFNAHFLPINFKSYFWNWRIPRLPDGTMTYDPEGNSMFLVTPPLLFALLAWRSRKPIAAAAAAGAVPLIVLLQFYFATGFNQFGNRYLLDAIPFLLILVGLGMKGRMSFPAYLLIILAIAANLFGIYKFSGELFTPIDSMMSGTALAVALAAALVAYPLISRLKQPIEKSAAKARGR